MTALPIYVLNLDKSEDRLRAFFDAFRDHADSITRIPAVLGSALPQIAAARLASSHIPATKWPGALGCTISHLVALETMLARGDQHCFVLEDDARPLQSFTTDFVALSLPEDYDICFVNKRMDPAGDAGEPRLLAPRESIGGNPNHRAPGTDGYLVSATGARKLLNWFGEDGLGGFLDWRLLAYCMTLEDCASFPNDSTARAVLVSLQERIPRQERLTGFVMRPSLVTHAKGPSEILAQGSRTAAS